MQKQHEKQAALCKDIDAFLTLRRSSQGEVPVSRQQMAIFTVENTSNTKSYIARQSAKGRPKDPYFNSKQALA